MSGIYIPDVSLPVEGDFELWIAIRKDGSFTYNVRGSWQDGKQKVVPVQEHGKLKDADAIRKDWLENYRYALTRSILDSFDNAPTIIPAEPPKEETE